MTGSAAPEKDHTSCLSTVKLKGACRTVQSTSTLFVSLLKPLGYTYVHEKFAQPSNQSAVLEKQAKMLSTSQRAQVLSKSKSGPIA